MTEKAMSAAPPPAPIATSAANNNNAIADFDPPKKPSKRNKFAFACATLASMTSVLLGYAYRNYISRLKDESILFSSSHIKYYPTYNYTYTKTYIRRLW
ncbi:Polyol transporter 5 [Bienertia sinuspersici]